MAQQQDSERQKLTLREEFRIWFRNTPRVWLIVIALMLLSGPLSGLLGMAFSVTLLLALAVLFLLVLPALIGAAAGSLTGKTYRWCRQRAASRRR
jgi:hypothetical protein